MSFETASDGRFVVPSFWNAIPHFSQLAVFPLLIIAAVNGGWWIAGPVAYFIIADFFEPLFGHDSKNIDPKNTPDSQLLLYKLAAWMWAILWPPTLVFILWQVLFGNHLNLIETILIVALTVGVAQSIFIIGHEMIHRQTSWERLLGEFLLASASYPQYATEHVYLHHRFACTPFDCSFAPKGRSFWQSFPNDLRDSLIGAWRCEQSRLQRRRKPGWHLSNPFWRYVAETGFWWLLVYVMGGIWVLLLYLIICFTVIISMKIINYAQHYGLHRIRLPNGRFERVKPRHSWSANYRISKWFYYNMQRHADHHIAAYRRYPLLQHYDEDESPKLPGSYMQIGSKVLNSKKWFKLMDPLVDEWRAKHYPEIDDWTIYDSKAFRLRPKAFDAITEIYHVLPGLYRWIDQFPELLDGLNEKEFTDIDVPPGSGQDLEFETIARRGLARVYWTLELGIEEMQAQILEIPAQTTNEVVENARNWTNEKIVQICMHVIRGSLSPSEAGIAMSRVGAAAINSVLWKVGENFTEKYGSLTDGGVIAVLGGDLASEPDTTIGSPLDIYLVYSSGNEQHFEALCGQFLEEIQSYLHDNILYAAHVAGDRHDAIHALVSFAELHRSGSPESIRKLIMSRCIFSFGKSDIESRFNRLRHEILSHLDESHAKAITIPASDSRGAVDAWLTARQCERIPIENIEHAATVLQLKHARNSSQPPNPDAIVAFQLAVEDDLISKDASERLIDATTMWRNLAGIVNLVTDRNPSHETASSTVKSVIAGACGLEDFDELYAAISEMAVASKAALENLEVPDASDEGA
ncbi:MAG: fatty acid desaturase [Acidiferrobacterales bacterium]|nr:fatty acid desaturase [Acidiferrobacterales bacterium]